jgi:hypothetical protein
MTQEGGSWQRAFSSSNGPEAISGSYGGIPISIYQDRHGSFNRNGDNWTLEEELAGQQKATQVGQALRTMGIQPIFLLLPQAQERLFGTFQDCLGAETGLAKVPLFAGGGSRKKAGRLLPQ